MILSAKKKKKIVLDAEDHCAHAASHCKSLIILLYFKICKNVWETPHTAHCLMMIHNSENGEKGFFLDDFYPIIVERDRHICFCYIFVSHTPQSYCGWGEKLALFCVAILYRYSDTKYSFLWNKCKYFGSKMNERTHFIHRHPEMTLEEQT